jgi:hypothetical protein
MADLVGDIFGGDKTQVNIPGPSAQELQLTQAQVDAMNKQSKLTDILLPLQLKQLGYQANFGPNGELTGVTEMTPTPEQQSQKDLTKKFLDLSVSQLDNEMANAPQSREIQDLTNKRTLAALKGELPVNPGLTRELGDQEQVLRDTLSKQLGTGYETSDPGIRALATFGQRKNETLEGARRGDLTLAEQLSNARSATQFGEAGGGLTSSDLASRLRTMNLQQLAGMPAGYNSVIQNINPFLNRSSNERMQTGQLDLNSQQFNSNMSMQALFGLGQLGGYLYAGPNGFGRK